VRITVGACGLIEWRDRRCWFAPDYRHQVQVRQLAFFGHGDSKANFLPFMPSESYKSRNEFSSNVMDVLFACGSWVIGLFVD
jgi:hypothetical protein